MPVRYLNVLCSLLIGLLLLTSCSRQKSETQYFDPPQLLYGIAHNEKGIVSIVKSKDPDAFFDDVWVDTISIYKISDYCCREEDVLFNLCYLLEIQSESKIGAKTYHNNGNRIIITYENGNRLFWRYSQGDMPVLE